MNEVEDALVVRVGVDGGEGGGLALRYNQANAEGGSCPEGLRDFTTLSSDFYTDLYDHYDEVHEQWMHDEIREQDAVEES